MDVTPLPASCAISAYLPRRKIALVCNDSTPVNFTPYKSLHAASSSVQLRKSPLRGFAVAGECSGVTGRVIHTLLKLPQGVPSISQTIQIRVDKA